jgi:non-heme chloroperoxidase
MAGARRFSVTAADGVTLSAQEWGNPSGPEILFIHGFMQSHLSWLRQVEDRELAAEFRMVSFDLRGHGNSDKPLDPDFYEGRRFADDVKAVIAAAPLKRPALAGWSYGGRIISHYLGHYGPAGLAGVSYVAAMSKAEPRFAGEIVRLIGALTAEDLATRIDATKEFVRACFERQPSEDDFGTMVAFNMLVPREVRAAMQGRPLDYDATLSRLKLPVLVTHGSADRLVLLAAAEHTAKTIPDARLSLYDGVGHAPFWEDPRRFNRELAGFVRDAARRSEY